MYSILKNEDIRSKQVWPVLSARDPGNLSLAMSGVSQPVPGVSVTVGEDVDPPALPLSLPPGPRVVVGGTAEHSEPVRNLLEVHLKVGEERGRIPDTLYSYLPLLSKLLDKLRYETLDPAWEIFLITTNQVWNVKNYSRLNGLNKLIFRLLWQNPVQWAEEKDRRNLPDHFLSIIRCLMWLRLLTECILGDGEEIM